MLARMCVNIPYTVSLKQLHEKEDTVPSTLQFVWKNDSQPWFFGYFWVLGSNLKSWCLLALEVLSSMATAGTLTSSWAHWNQRWWILVKSFKFYDINICKIIYIYIYYVIVYVYDINCCSSMCICIYIYIHTYTVCIYIYMCVSISVSVYLNIICLISSICMVTAWHISYTSPFIDEAVLKMFWSWWMHPGSVALDHNHWKRTILRSVHLNVSRVWYGQYELTPPAGPHNDGQTLQ